MPEGRRRWIFHLKEERVGSSLAFLFYLGPQGLDEACHIGKDESSLLSLLIQVLIYSRNTFTSTPRNSVLTALWASLRPVKLKHRINHHSLEG